MRRLIYWFITFSTLLLPPSLLATPSALMRCAAAMDPFSAVHGRLLQRAVSELSQEEAEAFSSYIEMICEDVARGRQHIQELSAERKEQILSELLNQGNPWELARAFLAHRRLLDEAIGDRTGPTSAESLAGFERKINEFSTLIAEDSPPVSAPPIPKEGPQTDVRALARENKSAAVHRPLSERPVEYTQNEQQLHEFLRQEKLVTIVGDLLDPKGGSSKSRLMALLIARVEALLTTGSFGEIANLSVHPESPNIITRGRVLGDAFRNVEHAKRQYDTAQAKASLYESLLKLEGLRAHWPALTALRTQAQQDLQVSREQAGPDLDVYLAVKSYLELVLSNTNCTIQCRVNALQTLSHLGIFDVYSRASSAQRDVLPQRLYRVVDQLPTEERAAAQAAVKQFDASVAGYRFFQSSEINNWKNSDPVLLQLVARKTLKRRFWSAVGMVYSSNVFGKVMSFLQQKARLDWLPFTERFARDARDRNEILHSVGTLLVMARSNLPIHVKMANIEALAAVHPQALVTMHRNSLFRGVLADINDVREHKDDDGPKDLERLKEEFALLFAAIDQAAKHPDANRLLNLQYDQPRLAKAYNLLVNSLVVAVTLVNLASPELASQYHVSIKDSVPAIVRELIEEVDDPVHGVMEDNPEMLDEIRGEITPPPAD